jgi:hypothetical protein
MNIKTKNNLIVKKIAYYSAIFCLIVFLQFDYVQMAYASGISSQEVVKLVNEAREKEDLKPLLQNSSLSSAAEQKAKDMIQNNYFAHISPSGVTPWYWIEKNNYDYRFAGENLAINFTDVNDQQEAWMKSESHRKNILNPKYTEIGVAVVRGIIDGHMTTITVQEFATPMDSTVKMGVAMGTSAQVLGAYQKSGDIDIKPSAWDGLKITYWAIALLGLGGLLIIESLRILQKRQKQEMVSLPVHFIH